jgi:hypothetical protein
MEALIICAKATLADLNGNVDHTKANHWQIGIKASIILRPLIADQNKSIDHTKAPRGRSEWKTSIILRPLRSSSTQLGAVTLLATNIAPSLS